MCRPEADGRLERIARPQALPFVIARRPARSSRSGACPPYWFARASRWLAKLESTLLRYVVSCRLTRLDPQTGAVLLEPCCAAALTWSDITARIVVVTAGEEDMASGRSLRVLALVCSLGSTGCKCSKQAPSPATRLPASAAGTSSAAGPGVPAAFNGTVTHSIKLTDEERAAIDEANGLSEARNAENRIHTSLLEVAR